MYHFLHDMTWVLPLRSPLATQVADGFTFLGYTPFFLIFMPLVYWFWDRSLFMRLALVIVITAILNGWLKDFWQDPRPPVALQIDPQKVAGSYGRPSGHAQVAAAMWFWLAYEIRKPWAWIAAAVITAGVSLSRLYLAVHDIDDVLTGLALGIGGLFLLAFLLGPNFNWWRRLPNWVHFIAFALLFAALWYSWPLPHYPQDTEDTLIFFVGAYAGTILDHHVVAAQPARPAIWLCVVLGVLGVMGLFALQTALTDAAKAAHLAVPVAGASISFAIGFYVTAVAPFLFRLVGVGRKPLTPADQGLVTEEPASR
ncbi:MAG TPA: phosphatase PAP2 family protein [Rhizomicrobium sp.]|nr:phosphatase PAP2 family protein [Rhizomicrobium sp.]